MGLTTIVAGLDLSVPSEQALERAAAPAQHNGATLLMEHAQADDAPIENVDSAVLEQLGEVSAAVRVEEAKRLAEKSQQLSARGISVELISRRRKHVVPRLAGARASGLAAIVNGVLKVEWTMGDGCRLRLLAHFGTERAVVPGPLERGETIWESGVRVGAGAELTLEPGGVHVLLQPPR